MDSEHYLNIVERIVSSKSFGRSNTYANLLRYLVKGTLEQKNLKETTIANDIFGKEDFDPSESTLIRVYVYNLRKKLAKYYANEGSEEITILEIPKGSYEVQFIEKPSPIVETGPHTFSWKIVIPSLAILSILGVIWISASKQSAAATLWQDIIEDNKPSLLVLGDLLVFNEKDNATGVVKTVRDTKVNSKGEFEQKKLQSEKENKTLELLSYTYLIKNSTNWVKDLSAIFFKNDKDFAIRTMSRFNPKELSDNNLIVVGMLKTLGLFQDYFSKEGYTIEGDVLSYSNPNTDYVQFYIPDGDPNAYHTDYAVILKTEGPKNNAIYLFGGIWDTGASESLRNFTNTDLAEKLQIALKDKFGEIPKKYCILLKVSGIDRMELNSTIIHINKIE